MLAENGAELGGPWSDHLEGPVWELRIRPRDVAARATYRCTADGTIVLLTVPARGSPRSAGTSASTAALPLGVMPAARACRLVTGRAPRGFFTDIERVQLVLTTYATGEPIESRGDISSGMPSGTLVWVVEIHAKAVNWNHSVQAGYVPPGAARYRLLRRDERAHGPGVRQRRVHVLASPARPGRPGHQPARPLLSPLAPRSRIALACAEGTQDTAVAGGLGDTRSSDGVPGAGRGQE